MDVVSVDYVGRSGGLASLWDLNVFEASSVIKRQWFLVVSKDIKGMHDMSNIVIGYTLNEQTKWRYLWEAFLVVKGQLSGM